MIGTGERIDLPILKRAPFLLLLKEYIDESATQKVKELRAQMREEEKKQSQQILQDKGKLEEKKEGGSHDKTFSISTDTGNHLQKEEEEEEEEGQERREEEEILAQLPRSIAYMWRLCDKVILEFNYLSVFAPPFAKYAIHGQCLPMIDDK